MKEDTSTIQCYKNIHYAKAERFEEPKMIETILRHPVRNQSVACPQIRDYVSGEVFGFDEFDNIHFTEDCHVLSVYKPKHYAKDKPLPVMVWIHGGGYTTGFGDSLSSNPSALVEEQEVIVVTLNYRLGIFGFAGGFKGIPANLGLLDVITALQWVQKHIRRFGGNPHNVTLFGQSAGADIIHHLMVANGVEGLFHKVILQSAPFGLQEDKEPVTDRMMALARTKELTGSVDSLLKVQEEMNKAVADMGLHSGMPFGVQYGYAPLPRMQDRDKVYAARSKMVEVLIGDTSQETSFFIDFLHVEKFTGLPLMGKYIRDAIIQVTTDIVYDKGAKEQYRKMKRWGYRVNRYKLSFAEGKNAFGATHTSDLPLLFWTEGTWENGAIMKDISLDATRRFGRGMRKLWGRIAHGHMPKGRIKNSRFIYY